MKKWNPWLGGWTRSVLDMNDSPEKYSNDVLQFLRDRLFISILFYTIPVILIAYPPSLLISLKTNKNNVALFDTIAFLLIIAAGYLPGINIRIRKIIYSSVFFALAIILFVYMDFQGPSLTILFCITILITLFFGTRQGFFLLP